MIRYNYRQAKVGLAYGRAGNDCKPLTHNAVDKINMHNLTCTSTFGNFQWTATVDVTDEQAVELAKAGLLQIIQRSPASKAEKAMANDGKGYEKRPKDFVRSSIPFSDDNAATLGKFLGEKVEISEGDFIKPSVKVIFHEIGAAKEPAYAKEKEIVNKHANDLKDIVTWAVDKIGYTGGGELNANNVELLKAVKAFKDALIAREL